jgi:septum formation topological specificity factor MinE
MDHFGEIVMAHGRRGGQGYQRQPLPGLRPDVHEVIGRRLKLHYEELQIQPLPDRLARLLDELDRALPDPVTRRLD